MPNLADGPPVLVIPEQTTSHLTLPLLGPTLFGGALVTFYTTGDTKELRVTFQTLYGVPLTQAHSRVYTLLRDVQAVHGFIVGEVVYLYALMTSGAVKLVTYTGPGPDPKTVQDVDTGFKVEHLRSLHCGSWYFLVFYSAEKIYLLRSKDPGFRADPIRRRIFTNSLDTEHLVMNPSVSVHPDDLKVAPQVTRITVAVERVVKASGLRETGFFIYELELD